MSETRTRPARDRQRFLLVARANQWFYKRMCNVDDVSWEVMDEWRCQSESVKIRRFNNANPQTAAEQGEDDSTNDASE